MPMVIQPLVRRWANVLMSACPNIGPTLANSKNSISVIIQLPKIWLACQPLTNIGPMLEWCWHYVPNIGPMLGQVDIGTLAQRRTNGWPNIGPSSAQHWHVYGVGDDFMSLVCNVQHLTFGWVKGHQPFMFPVFQCGEVSLQSSTVFWRWDLTVE